MDDPRSAIAYLAAQAGLSLGDEDMEALLLSLPLVRAAMAALSAPDYGETEPAGRFRAPGPAR